MNAKEYLKQAFYLDKRINSKLEQVESLNALATKATSTLSDMPKSPNRGTSKLEDKVDVAFVASALSDSTCSSLLLILLSK